MEVDIVWDTGNSIAVVTDAAADFDADARYWQMVLGVSDPVFVLDAQAA